MHKCPKCGSQEILGLGIVTFDPEDQNFKYDAWDAVDDLCCASCGHELTEEEASAFWGNV